MSPRPARIVDCHVHLWDPANTEWYPYLSGGQQLNMGDTTGMQRVFDASSYRRESAGWNVVGLVNVAAATGRHSVSETLAMEHRDGVSAIVGGLPPADSIDEAIGFLDKQMQATKFRGVRPMGAKAPVVPEAEVLQALVARALVFDAMPRTEQLLELAAGLKGQDDLTVVVEHTGWPRTGTDEEFAQWKPGIDALAALGPQVHCKLSGLAMPLGSLDADVFRPWVEYALGAFGVDRCMFASNFPVDGMHGTLDQLWSVYDELTASLSESDRDKLFATNAERVYRI